MYGMQPILRAVQTHVGMLFGTGAELTSGFIARLPAGVFGICEVYKLLSRSCFEAIFCCSWAGVSPVLMAEPSTARPPM